MNKFLTIAAVASIFLIGCNSGSVTLPPENVQMRMYFMGFLREMNDRQQPQRQNIQEIITEADGLTENDRLQWLEDARVHAILDCSLLSRDSLRSGFRCYRAFANQADPSRGSCLPPKLDIILAWSTIFRSKGTFSNYIAYVRTVCLLCKVSVKACVNLGQ